MECPECKKEVSCPHCHPPPAPKKPDPPRGAGCNLNNDEKKLLEEAGWES